jgi:hypothetical protein
MYRRHHRPSQERIVALPSNYELVEDATVVLPVITRSARVGTPSAAFDVVILGIKSDIAASGPSWLHHVSALLPNITIFKMLGDGQMLWLYLPQMVVVICYRLRLITILNVLHVFVICRAAHGLSTLDLQSLFGPLMESLHSYL